MSTTGLRWGRLKNRCYDYHIRWVRPPKQLEDSERIAIREVLALGKAVYDQRCALDLSVIDLARRIGVTPDEMDASRKAAPSLPSPCCAAWAPPWTSMYA